LKKSLHKNTKLYQLYLNIENIKLYLKVCSNAANKLKSTFFNNTKQKIQDVTDMPNEKLKKLGTMVSLNRLTG